MINNIMMVQPMLIGCDDSGIFFKYLIIVVSGRKVGQ